MYNFQQCVIFIIIIILFLHPPWVWGCCFCFPLTPLEGKEGQALAVPPAAAPRNRSGPMQCVWPVPAEKKKPHILGRNQLEMVLEALPRWRAPCSPLSLLGGWHGAAGQKARAEVLGVFGALRGAGVRRAGRPSHRQSDNLRCQARRGILGSGVLSPLLSLYPARVRVCCESGLWHCPATLGGPASGATTPPPQFWGAHNDGWKIGGLPGW